MGDPAAADEAQIPDMYWHAHPEWVAVGDRFHVACHYQLLIDIQLDNTHAKYVHPTSLANDGALRTQPRVRREANAIHAARLMPNSDPQPLFVDAGFPDKVADVWITWTYRPPATITFDAGVAKPGTGAFEGNRSQAMTIFNSHGITPETDRTTHHFWVSARNFAIGDDAVTRTMSRIRDTFLEDVVIVEAQQRCIDEDPAAPIIDVNADNPTIQARNLMDRLITAEGAQP
jgi:vanillate O-demethylase monooxygenase subunit